MDHNRFFESALQLNRPLTLSQIFYLNSFSEIRHMKRQCEMLPDDPILEIVGLTLGHEGEFFVGSKISEIPLWTLESHYLFKYEFKQKVLLLLYIQKYHVPNIDIHIFSIL